MFVTTLTATTTTATATLMLLLSMKKLQSRLQHHASDMTGSVTVMMTMVLLFFLVMNVSMTANVDVHKSSSPFVVGFTATSVHVSTRRRTFDSAIFKLPSRLSSTTEHQHQDRDHHQTISAASIFMEIGVDGDGNKNNGNSNGAGGPSIGRLIFHLSSTPIDSDEKEERFFHPLPVHTENFIQLIKGSFRSIDPRCHYVGCTFEYNPNTVELFDGERNGRYKWSHACLGRQRNVISAATNGSGPRRQQRDQPIKDPTSTVKCTHTCFGGQYYGWKYIENRDDGRTSDVEGNRDRGGDRGDQTMYGDDSSSSTSTKGSSADDPNVMLCVAVAGPNYGSTKFSIVRVGESPPEWKERLLLNTGVIGKMDPSCYDVLLKLARQTNGPPVIVSTGVC